MSLKNLMKTAKHQRAKVTRITSPLAKYNDLHQLTCIVCKTVIKTDSMWPDHLASASHKKNVELLRQKKREREAEREETNAKRQKLEPVVEPAPAPEPVPFAQVEEKAKFIEGDVPADFFDDAQEQAKVVAASTALKVAQSGGYVNIEEKEEEERALRDLVLEMEKKEEEEKEEEKEEESNDDEVVGVVDLQYEPVYEPLALLPQTVKKEIKPNSAPAVETVEEAAKVEEYIESEYDKYKRELQAIEEEKQSALKKLESLKTTTQEKPKRTLPGTMSTLRKRQKKVVEEEDEDMDLESWRSTCW
eukprot:TRINITY_DN6443_c1_g1_i1.p1 TRINITY_DN6443_c1_g1~~TRINITY_DN6443_c1_g1_i1.p1  ORF type:complete len:304 (+),score=111.03 TRINITY_DN6443_c1_g1_i1:27-938(+)